MFTSTYDIKIIYKSIVKLYILQIADVLQYPNSAKWLNEEISGVVTQITNLCTIFDKKK